jgi:ABC-type transport system involved in multi-copper enzyme maturation permease subunit
MTAQSDASGPAPTDAAAATHPQPSGAPSALGKVGAFLAHTTLANPVLVKEFRTRMRGARTYWLLLGYTTVLALLVGFLYLQFEFTWSGRSVEGNASGNAARELGRAIYYTVFVAQALLVALITPALTAGSITIEREQRLYELLATSPLSAADIVRGKLCAASVFVLLLLTASLPFVSLSFLVGGVSPEEILASYLLIGVSAFFFGAVGMFWSGVMRTTSAATVLTYMSNFLFFVATAVAGSLAWSAGFGRSGPPGPSSVPFQAVNPLIGIWRGVEPELLFAVPIPGWVGGTVLNLLGGLVLAAAAGDRLEHFVRLRPFWLRGYCTLFWLAFSLLWLGPVLGGIMNSTKSAGAFRRPEADVISAILAVLLVVVPVLNTSEAPRPRLGGEEPDGSGSYWSGFWPHRMFQRGAACGVPLVLFWLAMGLGLVPLGLISAGKASYLSVSSLLPASIAAFAAVLGIAGLGHLFSAWIPSRAAACILTFAAGLLLVAVPYGLMIPWEQLVVRPTQPSIMWQWMYLVPFEAVLELADGSAYRSNRPPLLFGSLPLWPVTTLIYGTLGGAGFLLTGRRRARFS